jgi:Cu(I)/Ag(I) efflux system membrane fusion protein
MMKTLKTIVLFLILLAVVSACNTKNKEEQAGHKSKETTFYTCSMDPQIKEDQPGKCPICHMELTPVKQDETNSNEISLSKQQIQLGNITTQTIAATQSNINQNYTGVLTINQEKIKTVSSRAMGRIEKLYVKTIGDFVSKNQPLYSLYSQTGLLHRLQTIDNAGGFWKKCSKYASIRKTKTVVFWFNQCSN